MITSKQNALVKEIKSLSDKKFRDRIGIFVVEGVKPVKEALALGLNIREIIISEKVADAFSFGAKKVEIVSEQVFSYISEEKTPQGVLATIYKPQNDLVCPKGNCLLLDGVSDPSNVGAIIRTAAASGFNQVYMTQTCADPYSQKAVRASMSGVFRVDIMRGEITELLSLINLPLWVADMNGKSIFSVDNHTPLCLAIGNEGNGVSNLVKSRADFTVCIPMQNGVESLNAAVSASILMYNLNKNSI